MGIIFQSSKSIYFFVLSLGFAIFFLKARRFGCLLLNDMHRGGCNGHEQNIAAFQATKTPLPKTTGPQNYQNTITTKQIKQNYEKSIILGLLAISFLLYRIRS